MGAPAGFTLGELAAALRATLEGDPGRRVTGVAPLETAGPEQVSFLIDARYRASAEASRAGALLVAEDVSGLRGPLLRSTTPQQALIALLTLFHPPASLSPGIHPSAVVASDARIDPSASIGALAVIGADAVIGPRVRVHPLVYVGPHVEVGEESVLHPRVVLGCLNRSGERLGVRAHRPELQGLEDAAAAPDAVLAPSSAAMGSATPSTAAPTARSPRWASS